MSRKLLIFLGLSVLCFTSVFVDCGPINDWQVWQQKNDKRYDNKYDEMEHLDVWLENYELVREHNADPDRTFTMELNHLADQVNQRPEFTYNKPALADNDEIMGSVEFVPDSWDWRTRGAVGPVHSQGQLGDALAFVTAECVDSFHAIQNSSISMSSVVEVYDCCTHNPIQSTVGVFECVHNIGGLCSETEYPKPMGKCMNDTCTDRVRIHGGKDVARGDEVGMMAAAYKTPVLALIDASHASFQLYRSGVYSEPKCSATRLDHALQVVGYGTQGGSDYWICRNSWGENWGMKGYILIARNKGNMCGIATSTSYPV